MKITIDTQVDTYEDIKKVLHILTSIIEHKEGGVVLPKETTPVDTTNLMSMFGGSDEPEMEPRAKEVPDTPPNFSAFLNLAQKKEQRRDEPRIEFY